MIGSMKFIINLMFLTVLLGQQINESIQKNTIKFTGFSLKDNGAFIVLPNDDFSIKESSGIVIQKAFMKRNNAYYEITVSDEEAVLILEFNSELMHYQRSNRDLSLNRLFFDAKRLKDSKATATSKPYLYDDTSIKIITEGKGVYRLTSRYFIDNEIDMANVFTNRLKLYNKGKEVPLFIESGDNEFIDKGGEYILFYAESNLNTRFPESEDIYFDPYDRHNIYWLVVSSDEKPGLRLFLKNGLNIEKDEDFIYNPLYYNTTKHLEQNDFLGTKYIPRVESEYSNKGVFHHRDYYFWSPTIRTSQFIQFDFSEIDNVYLTQNDSVSFEVMMSGSAGTYTGPHRVEFKISSGTVIKEENDWRYSHRKKLNFKIPYSFLRENENTFEAKAVYNNDQLLMNWMKVNYNSKFVAKENAIEFNAIKPDPHPVQGEAYSVFEYQIDGFETKGLFLMKKNEAIINNTSAVKQEDGTFSLIFQDEIENENAEFIAFTTDQFKQPVDIRYNKSLNQTSLLTIKSDAEMLIIAPEVFLEIADEYSSYKNQFLQTKVIPTEAIYNEFGFGNESPVAIREFLKFAYEKWSPENTLKYVLFLGDAKRDYKLGNRENYVIPTFQFISERFGFVTSDAFYGYLYHTKPYIVDFNNNPISDLYIGRVPAENISELDAYLSKMKEYEESTTQEKNLFLSGNDYSSADGNREIYTNKRVFLNQNARMNNTETTVSKYNLMRRASDDPFNETNTVLQGTDDLIRIFNEGVNYISFLGHGAGAVWGDRNIMLQEDVQLLQNKNKYPLISSFTCFIGAFDGGRTMGEELVLQRNVGAIGVLGSSGVSLLYNQYMFGYYTNEFIFQNRYSYGEALSLGKYKYYRKGGNYITDTDLLSTPEHSIHKTLLLMEFNYLGDPSIRIKFPEEREVITSDNLVKVNQDLNFTIPDINSGTYTVKYELMDYYGETLLEKDTIMDLDDELNIDIRVSELTTEEIYYIKGSLKSNEKVYNFGKKMFKDNYLDLDHIAVVDPNTFEERPLSTNQDYRLKIVSSRKVADMTSTIKLYRYDQTRFDRYRLTLNTTDSLTFYSNEIFFVRKDVSDMDISEVDANIDGDAISFRNNQLKVDPTKYVISPIESSMNVDYSENTDISVTVSYPVSFIDTLDVYADYYRVQLDSIHYLGKDTVHFLQTNTNKVSRLSVIENYDGQYAKYRIRFYTDNPELELDSLGQIVESEWGNLPNGFISASGQNNFNRSLTNGVNFKYALSTNQFVDDEENTVFKIDLVDNENILSDGFTNVFDDKVIRLDYFNPNFELQNLDTSTFHLKLSKDQWRSFDHSRIAILNYNDDIGKWLDLSSDNSLTSDSTLIIKSGRAFNQSGHYAITEFNSENKFQVDVNFEIDGIKSDSIQFTSLNPKIKINLLSKSSDYVLNPNNITLTNTKDGGSENELLFSHSYSGINKNNLNIIVDGSSNFNEDGNYRLNVKVGGYTQLFRVLDGNREVLIDNKISQRLNISGSDKMIVYGNYPNPFGRKTIFPIQLSSSSNNNLELKIKIYSLSGLLVKVIDETNMVFANTANNASLYGENISGDVRIGMNYVAWDGYSRNGKELANGVYFAKIIYTTNNKTIEKIIKIAKLKGYN
jgi:hypothetical protein